MENLEDKIESCGLSSALLSATTLMGCVNEEINPVMGGGILLSLGVVGAKLAYDKIKRGILDYRRMHLDSIDEVPARELENKRAVYLGSNHIEEIIRIPNSSKIRILDLGDNCIKEIKNIPKSIVGLYLEGNKIEETTKEGFEGLDKLKILSIYRNPLTKLEGLEELPNLRKVYLSGRVGETIKLGKESYHSIIDNNVRIIDLGKLSRGYKGKYIDNAIEEKLFQII